MVELLLGTKCSAALYLDKHAREDYTEIIDIFRKGRVIAMSGPSVFFSYANEDKPLVKKLKKYLIVFKQKGLIAEWYDHNILPGTPLNEERARQLNNASLIVLCISPDFLVTDYCRTEMRRAMERYESGDAWVLPILLKHASGRVRRLPLSSHYPQMAVSSRVGAPGQSPKGYC